MASLYRKTLAGPLIRTPAGGAAGSEKCCCKKSGGGDLEKAPCCPDGLPESITVEFNCPIEGTFTCVCDRLGSGGFDQPVTCGPGDLRSACFYQFSGFLNTVNVFLGTEAIEVVRNNNNANINNFRLCMDDPIPCTDHSATVIPWYLRTLGTACDGPGFYCRITSNV